jgi:GNAT superfamily N-acetyltransferase
MNTIIRKGRKEDLPAVLNLIKELAEYERAPDAVTNTIEAMETDGFGPEPCFRFVVAETEEKITGMALFYVKYSTWRGRGVYLDDIIVTESYRNSGIGKKLFDEVVKYCLEVDARGMWWQVLEWNEPALNFYRKIDSIFDDEWVNCKLNEEQLRNYKFGN